MPESSAPSRRHIPSSIPNRRDSRPTVLECDDVEEDVTEGQSSRASKQRPSNAYQHRAFDDDDPSETWSTLPPPRKKQRASSSTEINQLGRFSLPFSHVPGGANFPSSAPPTNDRARPHASTYPAALTTSSVENVGRGLTLSNFALKLPPLKEDHYKQTSRERAEEQEDPFAFHPPSSPAPEIVRPSHQQQQKQPMRLLNSRRAPLRPTPPPPPRARDLIGSRQPLGSRSRPYEDSPPSRPEPEPKPDDASERNFW